jgi:hypothetical protein
LDQQVRKLWDGYRGAVRAVYEMSDGELRFDPDGELEERLEALVGESDRLRGGLAVRLPGNRRESGEGEADFDPDLDTVAVSAAAIDVAVAADVLDVLEGEKEHARSEGFTVPPLVELAVPDASEREHVQALLDEAGGLFPEEDPVHGSAPWPDTAKEKADLAIDRLIDSGAPVATSCGVGLLTLGVTDLISTVGGFGALNAVTQSVGRRVGLALRLFRSAIAKILALVGSERLIEAAVDFSIHRELDVLASGSRIERWAVGRLVKERESLVLVDEALASNAPDEAILETSLEKLCSDYDRTMRWGRRYAKLLKFAGPGVVLLGLGVPGAAGMAAANGIGLTYALFSLADRLDTSPFVSRVDGVPTRVRHEDVPNPVELRQRPRLTITP